MQPFVPSTTHSSMLHSPTAVMQCHHKICVKKVRFVWVAKGAKDESNPSKSYEYILTQDFGVKPQVVPKSNYISI